ncbi:MAG: Heat shock N-terminal [Lasallia pustulata]|uniref:Heat shock N-terminal n=1 Tax=Lasallia pustulata TaxID=136370 RepID=A0A5M8PIX3_9LECA|nr:MAG: Heat shock N-terminal [Lasallia pustulata]
MGANQSSHTDAGGGNSWWATRGTGEMKTCYYELLGVERQASDDEIKKAYRRKALELHPDRNYGNVEETTERFAEIQSAYEILSDPQERTWYDSHRDAILRDDGETSMGHFENNVRVTTADDLMQMFTRFNGHMDFSDSPSGFYTSLRNTFEILAKEEEIACEWAGIDSTEYPSFGHADDSYDDVVRPFYTVWNGFTSSKTFSWKDVYRYGEAPDRRVRRMMEKENKRFRDEAIREFNDAVRSLVAFVKKRDPRFKPNLQSEAERQKTLRDAAAAQAARSRAANQVKLDGHALAEWQQVRETAEEDSSEEEEEMEEHFECIVCNKTFKSEKQYEAHERSKKHTKAVQQLRRTMQMEDKALKQHTIPSSNVAVSRNTDDATDSVHDSDARTPIFRNTDRTHYGPGGKNGAGQPRNEMGAVLTAGTDDVPLEAGTGRGAFTTDESSQDDDEYASREEVEERILGQELATTPSPGSLNREVVMDNLSKELASQSVKEDRDTVSQTKVGKAKEKRARRAAQTSAAAGSDAEFRCAACQAGFPSKTRLFNHINDFGHAQPVPGFAKGGKGKKR